MCKIVLQQGITSNRPLSKQFSQNVQFLKYPIHIILTL